MLNPQYLTQFAISGYIQTATDFTGLHRLENRRCEEFTCMEEAAIGAMWL